MTSQVNNPWLSIPLADYEGHMSLPNVAQAPALAAELGSLLQRVRPASAALLGCSGGNGLEQVDRKVTQRVVALDINPAYVEIAKARFGESFAAFEPIVCDITQVDAAPFRPVALLFAGLLLEYVPLVPALRFIRSGLESGGVFGCVVQQESESMDRVSPSPYASLSILSPYMRILSPRDVALAAESCGLKEETAHALHMPNGKVLVSQIYQAV
jgi:SAM-dependent methyltransferase